MVHLLLKVILFLDKEFVLMASWLTFLLLQLADSSFGKYEGGKSFKWQIA